MLSLCHLCSSTMKGALVHRQAIGRLSTQHCPGRPRVAARPSSAAAAPRKQAQPLCGIRSSPLVARPPPLQMQQPSRPAERGCARATASINVMSRSRRRRNLGIGSSSDGARELDMLHLQGGRQDVGDERLGFRQVAEHPFPSAYPPSCCSPSVRSIVHAVTIAGNNAMLHALGMMCTQVCGVADDAVPSLGAPLSRSSHRHLHSALAFKANPTRQQRRLTGCSTRSMPRSPAQCFVTERLTAIERRMHCFVPATCEPCKSSPLLLFRSCSAPRSALPSRRQSRGSTATCSRSSWASSCCPWGSR